MTPFARKANGSRPDADGLGAVLKARLEGRRAEIEETVLARVYSVSDPASVDDPEYATGLRSAVSAAVAYGIAALGSEHERPAPLPAELISQARRAARSGVPLDTVLRRYIAGHALLEDFIVGEAGSEVAGELPGTCLKDALRSEAASLDHLIGAIAAEYRSETEAKARSLHQHRSERVRKLLAGELLDAGELDYDLGGHHIGLVAAGSQAMVAVDSLLKALDCRRLIVQHDETTVWAWLGSRRKTAVEEIECHISQSWVPEVSLAIGEPGEALAGWRLSHHQARVALPIAERSPERHVRYADVALLAAALQDEVLSASLRELYLAPLAADRDGGAVLRQTLNAYFATGRNITSTAGTVGVTRKTVAARLRAIEQLLGHPIEACAAEAETALRLEEMGTFTT